MMSKVTKQDPKLFCRPWPGVVLLLARYSSSSSLERNIKVTVCRLFCSPLLSHTVPVLNRAY